MGDARTIVEILLRRPETLMTLAVVSAALVPVAAVASRRSALGFWRGSAAMLAALGTAVVVATTLGRYDSYGPPHWPVHCLLQPGLSASTPEEQLNLLLFAPACFFGVLALRRVLPVALGAVVLSGVAEVAQSVTGMGTCQTSDVVRNVIGGTVAGLIALLLVRGAGWVGGSRAG